MSETNKDDLDFVEIIDDGWDYDNEPADSEEESSETEENTKKDKDRNKELSPEERKKAVRKEVFSWIRLLAIAAAVAVVINYLILFNGYVPSGSMYPTIEADGSSGARIIGFRLSYLFDEPKRGDIIIFKYPDDPSQNYVKRVIGLPGETVEINEGKVYISKDGIMLEDPLDEPYLKEVAIGSYGPYEVPEDSYFVMGDNRNNSFDSRKWANTYVPKENIIGKALFQYYPSFRKLLNDD